jgi:hypothetical protein
MDPQQSYVDGRLPRQLPLRMLQPQFQSIQPYRDRPMKLLGGRSLDHLLVLR